jgi:hypothetical protein
MSGVEAIAIIGLALKVVDVGAKLISKANRVNDVKRRIQNLDETLEQYKARLEKRAKDLKRYDTDDQDQVRKAYVDADSVLLDAIAALSHVETLRDDIAGGSTKWSKLFSKQHDMAVTDLLSEGRNLDEALQQLDQRLDHLRL